MELLPRRSVLLGAVAFGLAGCTDPSLQEDDLERGLDDREGDETDFDAAARDRVQSTVADAADLFIKAAELLGAWEADPSKVTVEYFDDLRARTRGLLGDYDTHVLPYADRFGESDIDAEWDADGRTLAELVELHESFLLVIEEVSIALVDAEGDPGRVPSGYQDSIAYIIQHGEEIATETVDALGEAYVGDTT